MAENPYAAPKSHVEDAPHTLPDGDFLGEGRGVPAGNGWRWIADAWTFTGTQRGMFIGVFLLYFLLIIAFNLVPFLGPIASTLLMPVITGGLMLGFDAVRRGEPLEVAHLFAGFQRHAGKLVALGAISFGIGIIVAIVMFVVLGVSFATMFIGGAQPTPEEFQQLLLPFLLTILIIIALCLPIYMAMWFAAPLMVLADLDIGAALKTSFFGCLRNVLPFLVWSVIILVFAIVATIPLALGWLLLGPVMMASNYLAYRDIFHDVP
jgi:hypothetical protein